MTIEELQNVFEERGIPYPVSLDMAASTYKDIRSGIDAYMSISFRVSFFQKVQDKITKTKELRDKYLKGKCQPEVQYI